MGLECKHRTYPAHIYLVSQAEGNLHKLFGPLVFWLQSVTEDGVCSFHLVLLHQHSKSFASASILDFRFSDYYCLMCTSVLFPNTWLFQNENLHPLSKYSACPFPCAPGVHQAALCLCFSYSGYFLYRYLLNIISSFLSSSISRRESAFNPFYG